MTEASKNVFTSKTILALAATAAAAYLPAICTALGVDPNGPAVGTVHGVGIPLGLFAAALSRVVAKKPLHLL